MPEQARKTPEQLAEMLYRSIADVQQAGTYIHVPTGKKYIVMAFCLREHDLEPCVLYAPLGLQRLGYSLSFCRPAAEFKDKFALLLDDS